MRQRCVWSNSYAEEVREVELGVLNRWGTRVEPRRLPVCADHEPDLRRFMSYVAGPGRWFLPLMLLLLGVLFAGALLSSREVTAGSVVAMGLLIVAFPFATPETVAMVGVRASIRVARFMGLVTIALGGAMLLLS